MKTSEVLQEARDILAGSDSWCQHEFHEVSADGSGRIEAHCAIGAIRMLTNDIYWDVDNSNRNRQYVSAYPSAEFKELHDKAIQYLAEEAIFELALMDIEVSTDLCPETSQGYIAFYNDHDTLGTQESVLDLYDKAIKQAIHDED